jgi:PAS domain S-box-containing protein
MTDDNADSQFRAMADFLPQLVWFTDHRGGTIWYNRRWYEYTGSNPDAMEGWGWVGAVHPDHAERALKGFRDAWEAGTAWEDTYPLRRHDGEYHWFLARAAPFRDSRGKLVRWLGTNTDINDRIEAERLQKLLTREVNHRVKNNLALVAGLLNMQARDLKGEARTAVGEAALRVSTVAQMHDLFWRHASSRTVNLGLLVSELCQGLQHTWPLHRLTFEVEPLEVPVAKAMPVALILNELATNAFKHAYGTANTGEVRVRLSRSAPGEIQLEVRDFGRGLPPGFDLAATHGSLGMKVIGALVRQIGARLDVGAADPGARFVLTASAPTAEPIESRAVEDARELR